MLLCILYPDTSYTWPVLVTDFNFKWCYDCQTTPAVSFDIAKSMQLYVCHATVLKISFDSEKELSLNKFVCHVKADGRIRYRLYNFVRNNRCRLTKTKQNVNYIILFPIVIVIFWRILTHWGREKMVAIFQTTYSNVFSWYKMYDFN